MGLVYSYYENYERTGSVGESIVRSAAENATVGLLSAAGTGLGALTENPVGVAALQRKLYLKAKREPTFRFYALYDKVYRPDILAHAYALTRANRGAPGVDGTRYEDIEEYGRERFLAELRHELQEKRYKPDAVLRVMIPKANGGERPLGIPTVRDRVVQAAVKLVIEPIFEADFTDNAYGYRPRRSAQDAVREIHKTLKAGYIHVVDADLSKFFDTIPHAALLRSVARRVSDGAILHLIKLWLKASIEERDGKGRPTRKRPGGRGTPQGGVLSPLLANVYMRRFLRAWELRGNDREIGTRIVNYADDFVILCRRRPREAMAEAEGILSRIGLILNRTKTRICCVHDEPFDFLGYSFGVQYRFGSGTKYLAAFPSDASVRRLRVKLRRMVGNHMSWISEERLVGEVNRVLRGWMNYFSYGTLWKTYIQLEKFTQQRLRGWLVSTAWEIAGGADSPSHTCMRRWVSSIPSVCLRTRARLEAEPGPRAGCGKSARPVR